MAFDIISVRDFELAYFGEDYSKYTKEVISEAYTEYVDIAGLFETEEFDKVAYIHYLNGRINYVKLFIDLQTRYITEFDVPYLPELKYLESKYSYRLKWENDKYKFIAELQKLQDREQKYVSQLENNMKQLLEIRKRKDLENDETKSRDKKSKGAWIRTINSLGKMGWKIDKLVTTLEELAYMVKQQKEEVNESKSKR